MLSFVYEWLRCGCLSFHLCSGNSHYLGINHFSTLSGRRSTVLKSKLVKYIQYLHMTSEGVNKIQEQFVLTNQWRAPEQLLNGLMLCFLFPMWRVYQHTQYLHRDDVGPRGVGHCHPVWQVHAAVTVGPEEGVRGGYRQGPGALPPLGGVLWRLHKGDWKVRTDRKELFFFILHILIFHIRQTTFLNNSNINMLLCC